MKYVECKTQAELDAAIAAGDHPILVGGGHFIARGNSTVTAWGNSTVTAWGNSTVTAMGNSTVTAMGNSTVTARGNSTVTAMGNSTVTAMGNSTVTAWGNSTVTARENSTVTARGNSTVTARGNSTVTARENSTVTAMENSTVTAWGNVMIRAMGRAVITASIAVVVLCHGCDVTVTGGIKIQAMEPTTAAEWCEHSGVTVVDGIATVYKGVRDNYHSDHGCDYSPGLTPVAADWDGGTLECGGGLHFSPSPIQTLSFCEHAKHFMACQVALADMRAPKPGDSCPFKIKARGCCAPVQECDRDGKLLETAAATT